jgi:hypothetical protein
MSVEQLTDFKQRLRNLLNQQADDTVLLSVVRQECDAGATKSEAYETLQEIWQEFGYDSDAHQSTDARRDILEYVMERVWHSEQQ